MTFQSVKEYWDAVKDKKADLPESAFLFTTSVKDRLHAGGEVVEVSREWAARLIIEGKVTLSTEAEVKAWKAAQIKAAMVANEKRLEQLARDNPAAFGQFDPVIKAAVAQAKAEEKAAENPVDHSKPPNPPLKK